MAGESQRGFCRYESDTRIKKNTATRLEKSQTVAATEGLLPMPPVERTQSKPSCETRNETPAPVNPMTRDLRNRSAPGGSGEAEAAGIKEAPIYA